MDRLLVSARFCHSAAATHGKFCAVICARAGDFMGESTADRCGTLLARRCRMRSMKATDPRVTFAELQQWPDDGRRYELYDGEVIVVPSPFLRHQRVAMHIEEILLEDWDANRIPPDLAVEVLSRSTEARDRGRKMQLLARFQVPNTGLSTRRKTRSRFMCSAIMTTCSSARTTKLRTSTRRACRDLRLPPLVFSLNS